MGLLAKRKAVVAVDLGAQSCRVSLLRWTQGHPQIELVHRFPNAPVSLPEGLCWDIEGIFRGVQAGLRLAAQRAEEGIASIGVDGWAVDYVRLDNRGNPLANSFCHRDNRTEEAEQKLHAILPPSRLYSLTGVQILRLNTVYQLYADKLAGRDPSIPWLNLPEFISYRLGGRRVAEYTNATHTALVALGTHKWCGEIFQASGLEEAAAPEIVASGSVIGALTGDLARLPAFQDTKLIVPACHDTAAAIAAIPALGDDWAFISSGTWSLVGTVLDSPCVSEQARAQNFTNIGGIGGKICFLKNVSGMWLLQQCMEQWEAAGKHWSLPDLLSACQALPAPRFLIDVDDPQLMLPGDIPGRMNVQLERAGHPALIADQAGIPAVASLIFHSLAKRYAEVLSSIASITGKKLKRLFIVGGGGQNAFLNRLTRERTGLEIIVGATESSTIGNFAIQLAALQGDSNPATGVSAASVGKWAEQLTAHSPVVSSTREVN